MPSKLIKKCFAKFKIILIIINPIPKKKEKKKEKNKTNWLKKEEIILELILNHNSKSKVKRLMNNK